MHHHHHILPILYLVYGIFVLTGGIMGYMKAKSTMSLVSGIVSGVLMILAAIVFRHHPGLSVILGIVVGLTLTIVFSIRYSTTKSPMPAIPVGIVSALIFLLSAFVLVRNMH